MVAGTVSLRYLILGLLAQRPMSGYDIKRLLKGLNWLIGSPSSGSLYPILRELLEKEMATVQVVPGEGKPSRKIYSITDAGRQDLQAWVDQPIAPGEPLKAFLMRLLLADHLSQAALTTHFRQRRTQVAGQRDALTETAAALDGTMDLGQRLALGYGLALASAELEWLDAAIGGLTEAPPP
jgi:PadR family transcriptional regulator AphA